jgi:hypothetical protein
MHAHHPPWDAGTGGGMPVSVSFFRLSLRTRGPINDNWIAYQREALAGLRPPRRARQHPVKVPHYFGHGPGSRPPVAGRRTAAYSNGTTACTVLYCTVRSVMIPGSYRAVPVL